MNNQTYPCKICGEILALSADNFYGSRTNKEGFDHRCKRCVLEADTKRRRAKGQKERIPLRPGSQTKICPKCETEKDSSEFWAAKKTRDKLRTYCIECSRKETDDWRSSEEVKDRNYKVGRQWREDNPDRHKAMWLKTRYGLTLEQFKEMLEKQNHKCAICQQGHGDTKKQRFCIDHCHATGVIRGLLCGLCNTMLGCARDNPTTLKEAIEYLSKFPKTVVQSQPESEQLFKSLFPGKSVHLMEKESTNA